MARQNANVPGGNVTGRLKEHSLRTMGRIADPKAFNELVITTIKGAPVRVRDIGWAEDGTKEQRSITRLDGEPAVTLEIRKQTGANTVAVIEGLKAKLPQVKAELPPDVKFEVIRDQSRYITGLLRSASLSWAASGGLVVLLFMRSWRSTRSAVAIPTSSSPSGCVGAELHLNSSMLVLMVGIVIDDAIVVLENIFRFVEEKKMGAFEAARAATAEIGLAVMATTLSLVVIFVPVSFMSSLAGRFLFQFGLTAAVAVLVSLLVSFTLTPMMSARLFSAQALPGAHGHDGASSRTGFYAGSILLHTLTWVGDAPPVGSSRACVPRDALVASALQDGQTRIHSRQYGRGRI